MQKFITIKKKNGAVTIKTERIISIVLVDKTITANFHLNQSFECDFDSIEEAKAEFEKLNSYLTEEEI